MYEQQTVVTHLCHCLIPQGGPWAQPRFCVERRGAAHWLQRPSIHRHSARPMELGYNMPMRGRQPEALQLAASTVALQVPGVRRPAACRAYRFTLAGGPILVIVVTATCSAVLSLSVLLSFKDSQVGRASIADRRAVWHCDGQRRAERTAVPARAMWGPFWE
jgi:hypothetical protein